MRRSGTETRTTKRPLARELRFAATQLALWAGLYGAYLFVRGVAIGKAGDAFAHAADVIALETHAGLFLEQPVQKLVISAEALRVFFDAYYMIGFGPLLGGALLWLAFRHRGAYRELRTTMLGSLALASIFFVLYPTAPPRLVRGLGIADTVGLSGHDTGSFAGIDFNPYAAMPSMHVGWSLLLALVGVRVLSKRRLRLLVALHPVLMTVAVTTTGNHFVVDALAGTAVALVAYLLVSCRSLQLLARIRLFAAAAARACAARGQPVRMGMLQPGRAPS